MPKIPAEKQPSAIELGFATALRKKQIPLNTERHFSYTTSTGQTKYIKPDMCIDDLRLAIEVDGHQHSTAEQKATDDKRDNTIRSHNWEVYRVKTWDLNNQNKFHEIVAGLAERWNKHKHQKERHIQSKVAKSIGIVIIITVIIYGAYFFAPHKNSNPSVAYQDSKYDELFSKLELGMTPKKVHSITFPIHFYWYPPTGAKEITIFEGPMSTENNIKIYFDGATTLPVSESPTMTKNEFTDAKVTRIERYYKGKLLSVK